VGRTSLTRAFGARNSNGLDAVVKLVWKRYGCYCHSGPGDGNSGCDGKKTRCKLAIRQIRR